MHSKQNQGYSHWPCLTNLSFSKKWTPFMKPFVTTVTENTTTFTKNLWAFPTTVNNTFGTFPEEILFLVCCKNSPLLDLSNKDYAKHYKYYSIYCVHFSPQNYIYSILFYQSLSLYHNSIWDRYNLQVYLEC